MRIVENRRKAIIELYDLEIDIDTICLATGYSRTTIEGIINSYKEKKKRFSGVADIFS